MFDCDLTNGRVYVALALSFLVFFLFLLPRRYEFALVLKPNDEYRDAVEVLELALDLRDGAGPGGTTSPQKLNDAKRMRESLDVLQAPDCERGSC